MSQQAMQQVLKPCPFCGSDAEMLTMPEGDDAGGMFVQCTNVVCRTSSILMWPLMDDVRPLLMEKWNRRTDARRKDAMQQALEALKNLADAFHQGRAVADCRGSLGYVNSRVESAESVIAALEKELALHAAGADKEVAAWAHSEDSSRVISDEQKVQGMRDGGASASSVKPYNVPLYAAEAAVSALEANDAKDAALTEFVALSEPARLALVGASIGIEVGAHAREAIEHNPDQWLCFKFNTWDEVTAARRAVKAWDSAGYRAKDATHQPKEKDNADR